MDKLDSEANNKKHSYLRSALKWHCDSASRNAVLGGRVQVPTSASKTTVSSHTFMSA